MIDDRKQLASGSIFLSLDSIVNAGLGGVFWIVVGKLAPAEVVGSANFVVALSTTLMTFAGLGFYLGASRFIAENNARGDFSRSRLVYSETVKVTILSGAAIAAALVVTSPYLASLANRLANSDRSIGLAILAGAFSIPFQALFKALYGIYQGCHKMAFCLITDVAFLVLRLALGILLLLAGYGAVGIVLGFGIGYVASAILGFVILVPAALPRARKANSPELFRQIFHFSSLNYFAGIFFTAAAQVPIALVYLFAGQEFAAYYNIAFLAKMVVVTISTSVGLALLPTVSASLSRGAGGALSGLYNLSMKSAILLSSVPIIVFFLIPGKSLNLISAQYAQGGSLPLQLLMISALGSVVFGVATPMLNGLNKPMSTFWATAISSTLGLAASSIMIPFWGIAGAAVANIVGGLSGAFLALGLLSWKGSVKIEYTALLLPLAGLGCALSVGELSLAGGINQYAAVILSLVALLGFSLLSRVLRFSELAYLLRLLFAPMKSITLPKASKNENHSNTALYYDAC